MEFEKLFIEAKGKPITHNGKSLVMVDRVNLLTHRVALKVVFVSTDSIWKQGVVLQTQGEFKVNGQTLSNKIVLWEHTAPTEILLTVHSQDKLLIVYNAWETEDGTVHYWHGGGAMNVEEHHGHRMYFCNDGFLDDDLTDLIFQLELTSNPIE